MAEEGSCYVRDYTAGDRTVVLELWCSAFAEAFSFLEDCPVPEDFRRHFDEVVAKAHRVWVAQKGSKVVGFISVHSGEVRNLFVETAYQRQGIGSLLLGAAIREQPGISSVSTVSSNEPGRRFYEKNGFVLERIEPHTFCGQQALIYRRGGQS